MRKSIKSKKLYKRTLLTFLFLFIICSILVTMVVRNRMDVEKLQMDNVILETSYIIHEVISENLYYTKSLAALVIQGDGTVQNFHETADALMENDSIIANFLLAPDGIVSDVYPYEENIAVLGLNLLDASEQEGNLEAILAYEMDDLVIAGPFLLRQGYMGLVGRYPVYLDKETENSKFWGLVSVTLKFPQALDNAGLSLLEYHGYVYELWRINPDTGGKQVIAGSYERISDDTLHVERPIYIHNAEWYLRIYPTAPWYMQYETWIFIFAGLCISFLGALTVQYNTKLKRSKITEANEFISAIYDEAPIGMNVFDENYNFIDFNDHLVRILGGTINSYNDIIYVFSPEYQPDGIKSEEKALDIFESTIKGERLVFEWMLKSSSGELIPCEVTTIPAKHNGRDIGLSYVYDLRHVREMESKINKLELELVESKISILLSQIKPHFLYNSLIAIRELCLTDPKTASETVDEFSSFLRVNLDSLSINTPISFDKELKHVETYLSLEKKRFEERLNVVYNITVRDFLIPVLTLQLLVENAVLHGLTKREEGGTVTIETEENETDVIITVSDDGVGFELSKLSNSHNHIGIKNARDRLAAMCNGKLDIQSEPGVGTTAVITIPKGEEYEHLDS